ncbi:hypothetical protein BS47DRAFT_1386219 [Hydnum rufescens UP504]|uniref:Uncharacterized protein n=1 Tax=Hydnum rufescens UP504 TaxID=1448309 RepID=A0A9P6DJA9_9AGAM|nr:hypothetical protein BS47DRAFT_1386219 [Hydnum rufescens UP504]
MSHDTDGKSNLGTMHFMSVKVSAQGFLFAPQPAPSETAASEPSDNTKYNKVAVWVVFYSNFWAPQQSDASPNLKTIQHQLDQAMILFPSVMESTCCCDAFQSHFPSICEALAGGLPNKNSIYTDLDFLQEVLIDHYTLVEAMLPHSINPSTSKEQIYKDFRATFMSYQESAFTLAFIPDLK